MKFCPMCGMPQLEAGLTVCQFCDYAEKPLDELSQKEICDLSVIRAAAPSQPHTWDLDWLSGSYAKVEWSSTDED